MTPEILGWISSIKSKTKPGKVLEVGSLDVNGNPRYIFPDAESYIGTDQTEGPNVDVVCLAKDLPGMFGKESMDTIICCEMLEHDPDPISSVKIFHDLLKKGGHLIITSPTQMFGLHRYPRDYWRFMEDVYYDVFFNGFNVYSFHTTPGNGCATCNCCAGVKL